MLPHHEFSPDMQASEDSIAKAKAVQAQERAQIVEQFPSLSRYFTDIERREQLDRLEALTVLRGIVQDYGADRVKRWIANIEQTPSGIA